MLIVQSGKYLWGAANESEMEGFVQWFRWLGYCTRGMVVTEEGQLGINYLQAFVGMVAKTYREPVASYPATWVQLYGTGGPEECIGIHKSGSVFAWAVTVDVVKAWMTGPLSRVMLTVIKQNVQDLPGVVQKFVEGEEKLNQFLDAFYRVPETVAGDVVLHRPSRTWEQMHSNIQAWLNWVRDQRCREVFPWMTFEEVDRLAWWKEPRVNRFVSMLVAESKAPKLARKRLGVPEEIVLG